MFTLLVTLIAIALGAYILQQTSFFGGENYTDGQAKAKVNQYRTEATQIISSMDLFKVEGGVIDENFSLDTLTQEERYLKRLPASQSTENGAELSWGFESETGLVLLPNVESEVCLTANSMAGYQTEFAGVPTSSLQGPSGEITVSNGFTEVKENHYVPICSATLTTSIPCCMNP